MKSLDFVYYSALSFITSTRSCTHHCDLYQMTARTPLSVCRQIHWTIFVYKFLVNFPSYLMVTLQTKIIISVRSELRHHLVIVLNHLRNDFQKRETCYLILPSGFNLFIMELFQYDLLLFLIVSRCCCKCV